MIDTDIKENFPSSYKLKIISSEFSHKKGIVKETFEYLKWVYQKRSLLGIITYLELRKNVIQTKLSYLWWLLDPLLNFLCYVFLMMVLGHNGSFKVPFALYMLTALMPWCFTNNCLMASAKIWERYKALIAQIRFPYLDLIIASFLNELVLFVVSFIIIFAACIAYGYYPSVYWLQLPIIILMQSIMVLSLMLLNTLIAFVFYDYHKLLPFILRIWFFLSPAIWSLDMLPVKYQKLVYLNPMTSLFVNYRDSLLFHKELAWGDCLIYLLLSFFALMITLMCFIKREPYINRYI